MLVQEERASMLGASPPGFNCLVSFLPASGGGDVELALG